MYNTVWIPNTEMGLDPNNSVIKEVVVYFTIFPKIILFIFLDNLTFFSVSSAKFEVDTNLIIVIILLVSGFVLGFFFFRHHIRQFDIFCASFFQFGPFFATFSQVTLIQ